MKKLSIRLKITIWFTATLIIVVLFAFIAVFAGSHRSLRKTIQNRLIEIVDENADEIDYYCTKDDDDDDIDDDDNDDDDDDNHMEEIPEDGDYLIPYGQGYLDIDEDFLVNEPDVYISLYSGASGLVYGVNPLEGTASDPDFAASRTRQIWADGTWYYIFDRQLDFGEADELWIRGVMSEEQGDRQLTGMIRIALIVLPLLVVLASVGGYLIARRALNPIQQISWTARQIGDGHDLKRRINLGKGNDELHQLAATFNEMFDHLEQSFEQERQFTSDVSHELRTPMAVIAAQCEYTLEQERTVEEYEEALQVIQRQGRKMTKLINHMLDFARLEMRSGKYTDEMLDMAELVDTICQDMKLIREHNISLEYQTAPVMFSGNRELLSRLLTNLISNAYRYGTENGHIFVDLQQQDSVLILSVRDDGIGIAADEQVKIFHRFYQTETSRGGEGTGLGLAMAHEIVRYYNGTIEVDSAPGRGSTFTVRLPLK